MSKNNTKKQNYELPWNQNIHRFTLKKMSGFMKPIYEIMKSSPFLFWSMIFVTILDAFFVSIIPKLTMLFLESLLSEEKTSTIFNIIINYWQWILILIVTFILIGIFEFFANYLVMILSLKIEVSLRLKTLKSLVEQDLSFYHNHQIGMILTRLLSDAEGTSMGLQNFLSNAVYCVATLIITLGVLFYIDILMAIIIVCYMLVVVSLSIIMFIFYRRAIMRSMDIKREIDTDITDRILNIRLIKSAGTENYEGKRIENIHLKYSKALAIKVKWSTWLSLFSMTVTSVIGIFAIILAILLYHDNPNEALKLGVSFSTASLALATPVAMINITLRGATKASNSAMRLNQLIDPQPLFDRNIDSDNKITDINEIIFNNVAFAYPDDKETEIISNLNMKLEKGKSYAFVGTSGSGKTTIIKLLLRLYEPIRGKILINNIDLNTINLPSYLAHVGYVEQEPQILYGTVMENLKYATKNISDEEVYNASKKAQLHDFILSLPDQYNTILGERGFILSGGQKQRLIIARMILKKPLLLIFDEATSALDNIVEQYLQKEIDKLIKSKISLFIAHRLSTIKNADEIMVISKNGVVQKGTYEQLKTIPGHFQDLYKSGKLN